MSPAWFGKAEEGAVMTGAIGAEVTVTTALPVPGEEPAAFETLVTV